MLQLENLLFRVCYFYDNSYDKVYSEKRKRTAVSGERERKNTMMRTELTMDQMEQFNGGLRSCGKSSNIDRDRRRAAETSDNKETSSGSLYDAIALKVEAWKTLLFG